VLVFSDKSAEIDGFLKNLKKKENAKAILRVLKAI